MEFFDKAFQQAADGKEEVSLSLIGGSLKKMMPKFKVKRYGCKTLGKLYERSDRTAGMTGNKSTSVYTGMGFTRSVPRLR